MEHKNSSDTWTVHVEQDGDDIILPLPKEMLEELDWQEGDVLEWVDNGNGTFSLRKQQYDSDSGVEGRL
jgi:antitoxin component of MazEF toxin-antitoxin module